MRSGPAGKWRFGKAESPLPGHPHATRSTCPPFFVGLSEAEQGPKRIKRPVECHHAGEGAALSLGNEEPGETGKTILGDIQMPGSHS